MNPGLYSDVIVLGRKRKKKSLFLQLDLTGIDRFITTMCMFIHQPTLLRKVE